MDKTKQIIERTKKLVSINSVVNTSGENEVATYIYDELSKLDYFKNNSNYLRKVPVNNDHLNRFNVVAMIIVDKDSDTIVGVGHFDTVDVDDYGSNKGIAFDVDALTQLIASDNAYLYGRGVLDMKSGLAVWMQLLEDINNQEFKPNRNIVVGFVCDEENSSVGMKQLVHELINIRNYYKLNYLGAIDSDYTTERYPDDPHRYVYFGTVGKLLVDIHAIGKETHASDPFLGVDANLLISAIIQEIVGNPTYTEQTISVTTPVPISLKVENPNRQYSVKTNKIAMTSLNIITYKRSVDDWMELIKNGITNAMKNILEKRDEHYQIYCENNNFEYKTLDSTFDVLFVEDVFDGSRLQRNDYVLDLLSNTTFDKPTIIISLSNPYYPAHETTHKNQPFIDIIMSALQKNYLNHVMVQPYYPYISDLSFLQSPDLDILQQVKKYAFDKRIIDDELWVSASKLDLAMVNIGPYGYDAHKDSERLEVASVEWVYAIIKDVLTNE